MTGAAQDVSLRIRLANSTPSMSPSFASTRTKLQTPLRLFNQLNAAAPPGVRLVVASKI